MKKSILTLVAFLLVTGNCFNQELPKDNYFKNIEYIPVSIPDFWPSRSRLPEPVLENKDWIEMYWKCWKIAFKHFKTPYKDSPFVSNYIDEAFSDNIFQWDMIFMIMFTKYSHHIFPAVNSLDNFYSQQHKNGYICREISEKTGEDFVFQGRLNTVNPPLFSWAEAISWGPQPVFYCPGKPGPEMLL